MIKTAISLVSHQGDQKWHLPICKYSNQIQEIDNPRFYPCKCSFLCPFGSAVDHKTFHCSSRNFESTDNPDMISCNRLPDSSSLRCQCSPGRSSWPDHRCQWTMRLDRICTCRILHAPKYLGRGLESLEHAHDTFLVVHCWFDDNRLEFNEQCANKKRKKKGEKSSTRCNHTSSVNSENHIS